ncbi:hypothetical protein HD553DRAFT_358575 [Filobasidium floriforme]|uniref:uncharacterized protein n=1 Tax=Filobasidium floriforme TaxID=5210 RepID=UPI001E8D3E79|nr:uncharacterized protein HD553DRAFT_358575 [Filobasidium floriforme]KAH8082384.1 hypothetical protein HD553DRAFT_358575 [Filobasidium floriforme]
MSTEATTGDKRKAEEQTVTATDDDAKKQKLGDEALTKESEVDTTVSESNIIPEGTERNAKPAAGELAEPEDEDEEKADKKEADADVGADEEEDEEEDVEEEEEGRRPRRRAAQKAEGYYGTDAAKAALGPNDNEEEDEDDEEVQPGDLTGITEGDDDEDEDEDEEEAEEK